MQKAKASEQGRIDVGRGTLGYFLLCVCMFLLRLKRGVVVTSGRTLPVLFVLVAGVAGFSLPNPAYATSCDAIIGKWMWFIGGEVTVKPDGTFVQQSGNDGTWECMDAARGAITLRWRQGGFVNKMMLSPDGRGLSSTDPSQMFVTAKRIGAPSSPPPPTQEATGNATAHHNRGLDLYKKGKYDEAIAEFTKAIKINPQYALAYINRGSAYSKEDQPDQAISDYTRAIEIDSTFVMANYNRGIVNLLRLLPHL